MGEAKEASVLPPVRWLGPVQERSRHPQSVAQRRVSPCIGYQVRRVTAHCGRKDQAPRQRATLCGAGSGYGPAIAPESSVLVEIGKEGLKK